MISKFVIPSSSDIVARPLFRPVGETLAEQQVLVMGFHLFLDGQHLISCEGFKLPGDLDILLQFSYLINTHNNSTDGP